jgi:hypothetical protein
MHSKIVGSEICIKRWPALVSYVSLDFLFETLEMILLFFINSVRIYRHKNKRTRNHHTRQATLKQVHQQ